MSEWIATNGKPVKIDGPVEVKHRFGMVKRVQSVDLVGFAQTGSPTDVTHIRAQPDETAD